MHWIVRLGTLLLALTISAPLVEAIRSEELDGISFADDPHMLFVPVEEIASALRWEMQLDQERISLNGHLLDPAHLRKLTNGTLLVPLDELQHAGATITWSDDGMQALAASDHRKIAIPFANKRVEVDLSNQRLAHIKESASSSTAPLAQDERVRKLRRENSRLHQSNRGCTAHVSTTTHRCRGACRCTRIFSFTDSGRSRDVPPRTVAFACR
jgi:hypothetical protein